VTSLTVMLVVGVMLALGVPGAEARPLYQTVPTMPPPTKSPTVTQPVPTSNPPANTPTHSPANTATSPAQPSATFAQVTSTYLTPTISAVVSTTAAAITATLAETTSIPMGSPSSNVIASNGSVVPQTEFPLKTEGITSTPEKRTTIDRISLVWLFWLVIVVVILGSAVALARWMLRKRNRQDDNEITKNRQ
jgi:hypothetical protein